MVILVQLLLFLAAAIVRGRRLFGLHLSTSPALHERLTYTNAHKGNITERHIGIRQKNSIPFIVKPERWYHRTLKNLGIASEIKIADTVFDQKYFIITDFPDHLERALASGKLLGLLQRLFALPVKALHVTPGKIWCEIKKEDFNTADGHYTRHFELLKEIANIGTTKACFEYTPVNTRHLGVIAFGFICVHAGLLTLGLLGFLPTFLDHANTMDREPWIIKGLTMGGTAAVVWLFIVLNLFKKSSWMCWVFVDFLLCGILGFMLSGIFVVREANTHLPQPPAQVYMRPVVQKICVLECKKSCGRRCTRRSSYTFRDETCNTQSRAELRKEKMASDYICTASATYKLSLTVTHWRVPIDAGDPAHYTFESDKALFDQTRIGDDLTIPVHPGALGLEWVDIDAIERR